MGGLIQNTQRVSGGLGVVGFIVSLIGLIAGFFVQVLLVISIIGVILSILQMKKGKTGLSIAGLVLGIIGIVFFLIWIGMLFFVHGAIVPMINEELTDGTACVGALAGVSIEDACKGRSNLEINLNYGNTHIADEIDFTVGSSSVRESSSRGVSNEKFILDLDAKVGDTLQVLPIMSGRICGVSDSVVLVDC